MNLRFEILRTVAANPGAPADEIADAIKHDRKKTVWAVRDCAKDGLLAKRLDDVTRQPGYTLTDAGKKRLAEGPAKQQGSNMKKGSDSEGGETDAKAQSAEIPPPILPEIPPPQYDPRSVSFNAAARADAAQDENYSLLSVLADIRAAVGDPEGRLMHDELVERVRAVAKAGAAANADLVKIRDVIGQRIHIGDPQHHATPVKCAEMAAQLIDSLLATNQENQNLISIAGEKLAEVVSGDIDTSDMEVHELAEQVVAQLAAKDYELLALRNTAARDRAELANEKALVAKLEHLLQSARNEAEHLRRHAGHSGDGADMVNHPPHYQGSVECIDAIESALGPDGFRAYCRGTAMKYAWRAGKKGDASEDMAKGAWYLSRAANINKEQQQ